VLRPETRELPDKECAAHASANDVREHFAFKWSEIVGIRDAMRKLWIPKVIEERVLNSLALFNEGIKDNFLFSSFLELRGYLDRICQTILGPAGLPPSRGGVSPDYWAEQLGKMLDQFEAGWRNRTHGGWRLGEVSDFNFEFKGGIQQLVSAFHGATQKLMWHFTGLNDALAVVTGKPGIEVLGPAVSLNLFDITKPEFFAARIGHEAAEVSITLCQTESALRDALARLAPPPASRPPTAPGARAEWDGAIASRALLTRAVSLTRACAGMRSAREPKSCFAETGSGRWLWDVLSGQPHG
jgi:hypothetical protein